MGGGYHRERAIRPPGIRLDPTPGESAGSNGTHPKSSPREPQQTVNLSARAGPGRSSQAERPGGDRGAAPGWVETEHPGWGAERPGGWGAERPGG
ncbi:hypothetical protein Acsp02_05150 [Actinoplanes sp. NBRC 103695]|nr:hypothetical protein Acsp02_05150 [Actinoplanes sp. NBRC 103695]